ncbi:NfeD family protein [Okeania sp.]|uniref:NfeD family protein n=1 Tax=Okeania sp. TaxID=3100323 RepID=UPI002B4B62EF|nr:NfeD family protein [Okeania sp.]MEB3339537.1 NfeD family protein [Okeania sp.]
MQKFRCDAPKMFSKPQPGVVEEKITSDEPGRVKYKTTYWPAMLFRDDSMTLAPGQEVAVVGRQGITLLVRPL